MRRIGLVCERMRAMVAVVEHTLGIQKFLVRFQLRLLNWNVV